MATTLSFIIYSMKISFIIAISLFIALSYSQCSSSYNVGDKCVDYYGNYGVCCGCSGYYSCYSGGDRCCGSCLAVPSNYHCCDTNYPYNYACPDGWTCHSYGVCTKLNVGLIVGLCVGAAVLIGLSVFLCWYCMKRRNQRAGQALLGGYQQYQWLLWEYYWW